MRRLLPLACAVVVVDTLLYAALIPLLPHYTEVYGLSKAGAGLCSDCMAFRPQLLGRTDQA